MNKTEHAQYIANLRTLDERWMTQLRAAGFVRNASRMIHKETGVFATRLGFEDGYLHRFAGKSVYAATVTEVDAAVRELLAEVEAARG